MSGGEEAALPDLLGWTFASAGIGVWLEGRLNPEEAELPLWLSG